MIKTAKMQGNVMVSADGWGAGQVLAARVKSRRDGEGPPESQKW